MNSKKDWEKFAEVNALTWEEGPAQHLDQHGGEYLTYIGPSTDDSQLLRLIGNNKHVIVRMFPHPYETRKHDLMRMRFSPYRRKPE